MIPSPIKLMHLWDSVQRIVVESGEESKPAAEHEIRIRGQYNQLLNNLMSVSEIAAHMFQDEKLSPKELEHIQQFHSTPIRASEELLNIIIKDSPEVYECFLQSLKKTNQHHVYQMLTTSVEQSDHSDEYLGTEHSLLIQRNYKTLIDNVDVDGGQLLDHLYEARLLTEREMATINAKPTKHEKSEALLALVSKFCRDNFKKFVKGLEESSQEHVVSIITGKDLKDAESEHKVMTVKTKTESCQRTPGKRIPPKIPPEPKSQLPATFAQSKPLQIPVVQPTHPSRLESVAENHQLTTKHTVNLRHLFSVETQFIKLQNELQTEVSTKIALLRQKTSNDNIWKICVEKILEESHKNVHSQSHYQATEEKCEKQRQEIRREKCKFTNFRNEAQQEKTRTEKLISTLQGKEDLLETNLKAALNDNEELRKSLQESQLMVDSLKVLNQQREEKTTERERLLSMQLNEVTEKLKLSDTEISKIYQLLEESENNVRGYMERKHHQENVGVKERNDALRVELALAKQELGDQATHYEQKLKENDSQLKETEKNLEKTESRLRETEKKLEETESRIKETEKNLEETEPNSTLSLTETEEKLKATDTKLQVAEAKLTRTQTSIEEFTAKDCRAKILDEQKQEERNAWIREKEQLISQMQEQRRLIVELQDKYTSDPDLVQTIRTKAAEKKNKLIRGMTILDKELFVVCGESSEVEVYDSTKFSLSRRWILKELINPTDIESCNRNKCLYIFTFKGYTQSMEILRVDPKGKLIGSWSTGNDWGWGLSVTDDSNVILTVFYKNKLNEYSPDGQLIREINLATDSGIRHPCHAIKLTNGHFLVSHGGSADDLHRVCVVDGDGKLKKLFGGERGSTIEQLNYPYNLAVDRNGFVIVADSGRVLLLNSDLEFRREIISKEKHGLGGIRIILDQTNNRLFVANNKWDAKKDIYKNAIILIFEFR